MKNAYVNRMNANGAARRVVLQWATNLTPPVTGPLPRTRFPPWSRLEHHLGSQRMDVVLPPFVPIKNNDAYRDRSWSPFRSTSQSAFPGFDWMMLIVPKASEVGVSSR